MLKTFETVKNFETVEKLGICILEDEEIGIFTRTDVVTIRGLLGVFNMTSNYNSDGDISKRNLEKKDMIYSILKDAEAELKRTVGGVIDITSSIESEIKEVRKILIGDNMEWTIVKDEDIEPMTLEQFEQLGTIYSDAKEDIEYEFDNLKDVFFAIIDLGFDLTKTNAFKEAKEDWFKSSVEDKDIFLDVFFDKLFDEDICFEEPKNIVIEEAIEDASFGYDYGDISGVHHCSIVLGYNVRVEDIE